MSVRVCAFVYVKVWELDPECTDRAEVLPPCVVQHITTANHKVTSATSTGTKGHTVYDPELTFSQVQFPLTATFVFEVTNFSF